MVKVGEQYIKWFSELNRDDVKIAGGKGANLGEMHNSKMPVPPGFVITTEAYKHFLEKTEIKEKISEILRSLNEEDTEKLEIVSRKIKELIEQKEMPKKIEEDILEAYENLSIDKESLRRGDPVKNDDQNEPNALVQKDFGLKTKQDHKISFGGLSGGPTVNSRNEVIGINVVESGSEGDFVLDEHGINYRPRVTLELLPSEELKRAMRRLNITLSP